MGHAVYTKSDPRAVILKENARKLAYEKGFEKEFKTLENKYIKAQATLENIGKMLG